MLSNLSPQSQAFVADISRVENMISQANQQVSSGLRVNVASDAPDVVSELLQLRASLQRNTQITANLGMAQSDANVADTALSSGIQLMDKAVSLGTQGATGTVDAGGRQALAQQVQALEEQMVNISQTQSAGSYIFSGDQSTLPAYAIDLNNSNLIPSGNGTGTGFGVDQLLNPMTATRMVEDPQGGSFAVSLTAKQIFDDRNADNTPATDNVFAALDGLRTALLNNNQNAIQTAVSNIHAASDHLNSSLAFYGVVENRIQSAITFAGNYNVQLQTQISQSQDADLVSASLELTQGTTQLQAAFQVEARVPRNTLFDFLSQT